MLRALIVLLCAMLLPSTASAEKRVALIIGNGAYVNVAKLLNPTRDVDAVERLLRQAGFDLVDARRDLGAVAMRRALRNFSDRTRNADVAVVFYSGHGIEVNGNNYLVPVDATLERDIDVEDEAIPLERVTQILDQARRLRLVILDACRDNPFLRTMKRTMAGRSIGRGLAEVRVLTADTLIAFAARAGSTALDGDGTNSPYTIALVRHLATPGLDLRIAFGRVRDEVLEATRNAQEPFVYGSLGGSEIALVSAATPGTPQPAPSPSLALTEAERAWAAIKDSRDARDFEAFRRRYGHTSAFFDGLAETRIDTLKREAAEEAETKRKAADQARQRADADAAARKSAEDWAESQRRADADARRQATPTEAERAWNAIKDASDPSVFDVYITQFGSTVYGAMARARLQELRRQKSVAAAPPAPSQPSGPAAERQDCTRNKDREAGIKACTNYIASDPKAAWAYYYRGMHYGGTKAFDRAIADFTKSIEIEPKAVNYSMRGRAYADKGAHDRALVDFNKAIELDPQHAAGYVGRGSYYSQKEAHDRAIVDYNKAIEINPKYAQAYVGRGIAYGRKGAQDRALADFNKAVELNPDWGNTYYNRGVAHSKLGNKQQAAVDYRQALALDPNHEKARQALRKLGSSPRR